VAVVTPPEIRKYNARKVVRGTVTAEAIICPGGFSFMGDVDMATGEIVAEGNPSKGRNLKGRVLIYKETKGSSGGCVVLMTLAAKGLAPAAIVTMKPADYNMTEGAILSKIPFMCSPDGDLLTEIRTGQIVRVDADSGVIEVTDCAQT
jgi:predicted aconitase with swiveling domain